MNVLEEMEITIEIEDEMNNHDELEPENNIQEEDPTIRRSISNLQSQVGWKTMMWVQQQSKKVPKTEGERDLSWVPKKQSFGSLILHLSIYSSSKKVLQPFSMLRTLETGNGVRCGLGESIS